MAALVLKKCNPELPLQLDGDTAVYFMGAVISHTNPDIS